MIAVTWGVIGFGSQFCGFAAQLFVFAVSVERSVTDSKMIDLFGTETSNVHFRYHNAMSGREYPVGTIWYTCIGYPELKLEN